MKQKITLEGLLCSFSGTSFHYSDFWLLLGSLYKCNHTVCTVFFFFSGFFQPTFCLWDLSILLHMTLDCSFSLLYSDPLFECAQHIIFFQHTLLQKETDYELFQVNLLRLICVVFLYFPLFPALYKKRRLLFLRILKLRHFYRTKNSSTPKSGLP